MEQETEAAIFIRANVRVHPESHLASKFAYGITIFTSAFLLFNVESIIANIILAWMGGAPAVAHLYA